MMSMWKKAARKIYPSVVADQAARLCIQKSFVFGNKKKINKKLRENFIFFIYFLLHARTHNTVSCYKFADNAYRLHGY